MEQTQLHAETEEGREISRQDISVTLSAARVLALLSIISAHTPPQAGTPDWFFNACGRFSHIGAVAFLVISGYYFRPDRHGKGGFWKNRLLYTVVPWIVMGMLAYLGTYLPDVSFLSAGGLLRWLMGVQSFLWYMPVLLICNVLFFRFYRNRAFCWACIGVTVASLWATASG